MMSTQPTTAQLQALVNYAARRMGMSPEALLAAVNKGGLDSLAGRLSPADAAKFKQMTGDSSKAQELLNSPAAQELLRKFK